MLEHGGRLRQAAKQYAIPLERWLDLSTGINPNGWPVPQVPAECWQRLPEADDDLLAAARQYYRQPSLLPVAGSQAAIQALPLLRPAGRVGVLHPAYAEHASSWQKAGHEVVELQAAQIDARLETLDVLIVINPNNPSGQYFDPEQLSVWHGRLQSCGGWLLIDEAFIDTRLEFSMTAEPVREGLIVLRSLGKFFGLAGVRCGFVAAVPALLAQLEEKLGPWTLAHPARYVAALALRDLAWQHNTRSELKLQAQRLAALLTANGLVPAGGSDLFCWVQTEQAEAHHRLLARHGILTRLFERPASLRFGLPKTEVDWSRLADCLRLLPQPTHPKNAVDPRKIQKARKYSKR